MGDMRIAAEMPDFFGMRGDDAVQLGQGFGCRCARCDREISAPFGYERKLIWCLYCGMAAGHVPMIDQVWGHRFPFGVTGDECREEHRWLRSAPGTFFEKCEARARREGRVLDLF